MKLVKFLSVAAAVLAFAAVGSGGAAAEDDSIPDPIVDPCLLVPADATLWLGPGIPSVHASAPGSYAAPSRPCRRFVVDIHVPYNSSGGSGYTPAFSIEVFGGSNNGCESLRRWDYLYRKSGSETIFELLGHVWLYGDKDATGCHMEAWPLHNDPWPAAFDPRKQGRVAATYRVVTVSAYDWRAYWPYYDYVYTRPTVRATHLPAA